MPSSNSRRLRRTRAPARFLLPVFAAGLLAHPGAALTAKQTAVEQGLRPAPLSWWGPAQQAQSLADRMAFYRVPGVSLAVIDGQRIAWARGYGTLRAGSSAQVQTDTLFQAASISKAVTATAAMKLVQDGRLALDAPVNDVLRSWQLPSGAPSLSAEVTLRQLLSHTAGIGMPGYLGYPAHHPVPHLLQVLRGETPATSSAVKVERPPGTTYAYSGGGYEVLQLLMQDVSGQEFPALMAREVLGPLGMTRSHFTQPLPEALAAHAAVGHTATGEPVPGRWHTYPELAAAGLWSTPSDLARWLLALSASAHARQEALLNPATMQQMLSNATPGFTRRFTGQAYGLGLKLHGRGQAFSFGHTGINQGYRAVALMYPNTGQGLVVMTNGENGERLTQEIIRSVAAAYDWPDQQPSRAGRAAPFLLLAALLLACLALLRRHQRRR